MITPVKESSIYVKNYFRATNLHLEGQEQFKESVWCEINLQDNDQLLIGTCIYRSPNSSAENHNLLQNIINKATEIQPLGFLRH